MNNNNNNRSRGGLVDAAILAHVLSNGNGFSNDGKDAPPRQRSHASSSSSAAASASASASATASIANDFCTICLRCNDADPHHRPHHRRSPRTQPSSSSPRTQPSCTTSSSYTLACGHRFHAACIGRWLDQHSSCPSCGRIVAAVTRLVLSSSQVPLPPSDDDDAGADFDRGQVVVVPIGGFLAEAVGWALQAAALIALIALMTFML